MLFVFLEKVKRVYATPCCRKHTEAQIQDLPVTSCLTGDTVRLVKWKKDHWEDEQGTKITEGLNVGT
jgi:hypothetical protein